MSSHRQPPNSGLNAFAAAFPDSLKRFAESSTLRNKTLKRGDVVWLDLAQNLSSERSMDPRAFKSRPFIILNDVVNYRIDEHGHCTEPQTLLGVDATSQNFLVDGRPHMSFRIPGESKTTFALIDSVRTVTCQACSLEPAYRLSEGELEALHEGLDKVLQPEGRFYLKWFGRKIMPGHIWSIKTLANPEPTPALVLLRRGRFIPTDDLQYSSPELCGDQYPTGVKFSQTPYLLASFRQAGKITTLRGIRWADVNIIAVNEQSFVRQQGEITTETVSILLNNLRERTGLLPIAYRSPVIKDMLNWLPLMFLRRIPRFT
jgi:hypothetical protein